MPSDLRLCWGTAAWMCCGIPSRTFCMDCVHHCGTLCRFLWLEVVRDSCKTQNFGSMSTAEMGFIDNKLLQLSMSLIRFMGCRGVGILQECWLILWSGGFTQETVVKVDHMAQAAQSTASDHDLGEAIAWNSQKSSDQKTSAGEVRLVPGSWNLPLFTRVF